MRLNTNKGTKNIIQNVVKRGQRAVIKILVAFDHLLLVNEILARNSQNRAARVPTIGYSQKEIIKAPKNPMFSGTEYL